MFDSRKDFSIRVLGFVACALLTFNIQAGHGSAGGPVSFSDVDLDGNGCVSEDEFMQFHGKMHGKGKGHGKGHGHGSKKGHGGGCCHGKGMKGNMPAFDDFDLDGNGTISEAEFNQGHAARMSEMAAEGRHLKHAADAPGFSDIDDDGNGEISKDEFAAHQADHHKKMHGQLKKEE
jgi:hypothetical protein